jgi:lipopolysaccharide heptosyltransferase II
VSADQETQRKWSEAKHLLCVRLDSLGDVLMTTPAIRALKQSVQGRRITLLTSAAGAQAGALIPEVDEVFTYAAPWMKSLPAQEERDTEATIIEMLQRSAFDGAVIFTVFSQNPLPAAFLCYLAGIPLRLAHCRENPYRLLTDWIPESEPQAGIRHEVQRQLDLVSSVGATTEQTGLSLEIPATAYSRVLGLLADLAIDVSRPWVLIHPGASAPSRRYPPESYAAVARTLVLRMGLPVVLSGDATELALVRQISESAGAPTASVAGRLDVAELSALISLASVLVANNSGPAHVAAAVGTPVVDCYALTNPQHTPWGVAHRVLSHDVACKYCFKSICPFEHHACLRGVSPSRVVSAVEELLAESPSRPAEFAASIGGVGLS